MLYVTVLSWKPGVTREQINESLGRRAQWQYPEGIKVVGEYWLQDPEIAVVAIYEASEYEPIMELGLVWGDVFGVKTVPATSVEEGLKIGAKIMERMTSG